jgi:hypothetical protein
MRLPRHESAESSFLPGCAETHSRSLSVLHACACYMGVMRVTASRSFRASAEYVCLQSR